MISFQTLVNYGLSPFVHVYSSSTPGMAQLSVTFTQGYLKHDWFPTRGSLWALISQKILNRESTLCEARRFK